MAAGLTFEARDESAGPKLPEVQAWLATWDQEFLFYRVDAHDRFTYVSASAMHILGYAPEELLGRAAHTIFDPRHPAEAHLRDLSERLGTDGRPNLRRCIAIRKDGEFRYVLIRQRDCCDAHGAFTGYEAVVEDETPRVLAELSLRQSEQSYQSLVEGLRGDYILYRHEPDGTLTYISPSVEDVLGFPPETVRGMNWRDYVRENHFGREAAEQVEQDVELGKHFHHLVVEIKHQDGTPKLLDIQEQPVFDAEGAYLYMEGIAKDITEASRTQRELHALRDKLEARVAERTRELEQMNEQLRESESRYRDLVEKQGEFVVRWGPDGRRRDVNDAYCQYLGRPREELVGHSFLPLMVEEDIPRFQRAIASLNPDHPAATYEHRVRRADGSIRWTQWTDTAAYDADGQPLEYLSVGRDVTELKRAEDRLREREDHLAHVSRLATMGELVAGIAHEIHQPLHAASTFAEAARRHLESGQPRAIPTAIDCTKEIAAAITRTAQIIRRLRDYTKAHPVQLESLSLNEVVVEAVEIMAFVMRRAGVLPRLELDDDLPAVHGDRIQLQQVCVNLIQNACDASAEAPQAEQQLLIKTYVDHGKPAVCIRDAGVGIDPDSADRLFDAFYSTKPEGMGMGLSLAKSIAEAHGAQLSVASNAPDPGATFSLVFPPAQETT